MSQPVLYRKFRPQSFAEVVGQEAIKTTLQNAVAQGVVAHAYLFTGPRGVGKTSLARILAKAVNCKRNDLSPADYGGTIPSKGESKKIGSSSRTYGEPCGTCLNCAAITEGRFLDLIEIDAASHTGVDNVREIIEHVKFSPSSGRYKVIVIDEAHMLSKGAFNALLKTLEEPPRHAIFVLATTEAGKVPATIVSRSQAFHFKRLSQADIVKQLEAVLVKEKVKLAPEVLKLIARAADGGMRDAFSLLDQLLAFSGKEQTLEQAESILGLSSLSERQDFLTLLTDGQTPQAYAFIKALTERGGDSAQFAAGFLEYVDMVLGFSLNERDAGDLGLAPEDLAVLKTHAQIPRNQLLALAEIFLSAAQKIKSSPLPELPLVVAAIEFIENSKAPGVASGVDQDGGAESEGKNSVPAEKSTAKPVSKPQVVEAVGDFLPQIRHSWNQFLSKLKDYNHSLLSSLRLATLVQSDGQFLLIAFPYRFHKDTVEQRKNKIVVEKALEEIYGRKIHLKTCMTHEIEDNRSNTPATKNSLLDEALKVFRIEK